MIEEKAKECIDNLIDSLSLEVNYEESNYDAGQVHALSNYGKEIYKVGFLEGQSNPKIKQLEWEHGLYNRLLSKTLVGDYTIAPMKDGYDMYLYSKNQYYWLKDYVNTIDEAKQYAQSDFEARIKECLITE